MKTFKLLVTFLLSSTLLLGCASTVASSDKEKYLFPELEQVDYIRSNRVDGWSDIDKQSLFVSTSPSTSYLIILKQPNNDLRFAQGISFDNSGSTIHAKFDRINIINNQNGIDSFPAYIDRIYKIESREQKKIIRAKIKGEISNIKTPDAATTDSETDDID